jgi:hypothetical protein
MRAAGTVNGQAVGGFTTVGTQTMYCSDCHAESSAGSLGPHGSSVKWMLKGPNKAWPYDTAAMNGGDSSTLADFRILADATVGQDGVDGLFCLNCHVMGGAGEVHTRGGGATDHGGSACVTCHLRVPHGGKVSRLLAATGDTAYPGPMPSRYAPNGNGVRAQTGVTLNHINRPAGGYGSGDCYVTGCTSHTGSAPTENW